MEYQSQMNCTKSTCCIESRGTSVDPMDLEGTIPAGHAGRESFDTSCCLAKIYFPDQIYRAGYQPKSALEQGSLFPELVRRYE